MPSSRAQDSRTRASSAPGEAPPNGNRPRIVPPAAVVPAMSAPLSPSNFETLTRRLYGGLPSSATPPAADAPAASSETSPEALLPSHGPTTAFDAGRQHPAGQTANGGSARLPVLPPIIVPASARAAPTAKGSQANGLEELHSAASSLNASEAAKRLPQADAMAGEAPPNGGKRIYYPQGTGPRVPSAPPPPPGSISLAAAAEGGAAPPAAAAVSLEVEAVSPRPNPFATVLRGARALSSRFLAPAEASASGRIAPGGTLEATSSMGHTRTGSSLAHYASLLLAENPTATHRQYLRTTSSRMSNGIPSAEIHSEPGSRTHLDPVPSWLTQAPAGGAGIGSRSAFEDTPFVAAEPPAAAALGAQGPYAEVIPAHATPSISYAGDSGVHRLSTVGLAPEAPLPDPDDDRVLDPSSYWYLLVKSQATRNAKRRGRRHYLGTLARLKHSFFRDPPLQWPSIHNTSSPDPLSATTAPRWWDWPYLWLMVAFDSLSPGYFSGHLAVLVLVLATMTSVTYMFMAGGYGTWLQSPAAASTLNSTDTGVAESALFERGGANGTAAHLWGPRVLARRIGNNTHLPDQYLVEWGALSPAALSHGGQGRRYFTALFVHRSWWQFFILAVCFVISAAMVERRYGFVRTVVMATVLGASGTLLAAATARQCSVVVGLSPLAWGFLAWWVVDVAAVMSFWMWHDWNKIKQQLSKWHNLSKLVLMGGTLLLLISSESALGESSFPSAVGGLLAGLMIAPALVPRWTRSQHEALSVVVAAAGLLFFCCIIPIAATARVAGINGTGSCSFALLS